MPQNLINRLRERPDDAAAWQRFDTLYRPLLRDWLRRYCLQPHDADDLVQQALEVVVRGRRGPLSVSATLNKSLQRTGGAARHFRVQRPVRPAGR
jgi:DNA-directed RNA polymerase specialized sigma24 family protein